MRNNHGETDLSPPERRHSLLKRSYTENRSETWPLRALKTRESNEGGLTICHDMDGP